MVLNIEEGMARQKRHGTKLAHPPPGEEVVITGLSGFFPECDNVYEFRDKLFDKIDLINDDGRRWKLDHPEIPQRTGKLNKVSKFDCAFFGLHIKQSHTMDPMSRMLLEKTYEAIIDAGYNPKELRGKRCGVYIGACFSETEKTWFYEKIQINGFGVTGCTRSMLANRLSYWLGVEGPSFTLDSACSSSLYALEEAYKNIREGICDMALVGSSNLCLHPYVSLQFFRLGVLSPDGACKCFDEKANGYCRSEAIPMIFLQKAKDARRIYSTIVHCKTNVDGYKEQGITYPSGQMQFKLLNDFYQECGFEPSKVDFIEAHGTGTKVGDPEECNTLDKVFCTGRNEPLWIGSIKSNIGHSEPASGLCSITKALIAMESGFIPPNIHFNSPREGIPAFTEGRLRVVTEKTAWQCRTIGVNSFGFGGANCHVLLKWNEKEKIDGSKPNDPIPRLVLVSGRTEEAVKVMLDDLESRPPDVELVKLYHDIHSENIDGHLYRGFTILTNTKNSLRDIQFYSEENREIWFVFSGLGSHWPKMGKSLMCLQTFTSAIEKCHNALLSKNINLKKMLTEDDPKGFDNILKAFVGVAAVQVGLVDVLFSLGVYPDRILGHSVGEFVCAYADGCLLAEEVMLVAYYSGLAILESSLIDGLTITVDAGYSTVRDMLSSEIDVACYNSSTSCTLSGPSDTISEFTNELIKQKISFEVESTFKTAFHSRYMSEIEHKLLDYLNKVIQCPKLRTNKWVSSSYSKNAWDLSKTKFCTPKYLAQILLSPSLFEENLKIIPHNSVVIELSPHCVLQKFLQKSLSDKTVNIPLMKQKHKNNVEVLLYGIGRLYEIGYQPQVYNLYPPVQYPVSRGTPMISPLVRWDHTQDYFVTSYNVQERIKSGERVVSVGLKDDNFEFMSGHLIDGRILFPATGYLYLVWETLGMIQGFVYSKLPVVFEKVRFNRATTLPKDGRVEFTVIIQKGSGNFEVVEGGAPVVAGRAFIPEDSDIEMTNLPELEFPKENDLINLNTRDIYKELRLRGYHYKGLFRGLVSMDNLGNVGKIKWADNYVAFMDNMLQTQILGEDTRSLYVPTAIQRLVINPNMHLEVVKKFTQEDKIELPIYVYKDIKMIKSGGVEIRGLKASQISRKKPLGEPVLEKFVFLPHITHDESKALSLLETLRLCLHLILENLQVIKVKVVEVMPPVNESSPTEMVSDLVSSILGNLPLIQAELIVLGSNNPKLNDLPAGIIVEDKKLSAEQNCLAVIVANLFSQPELIQDALKALKTEGYLIVRECPYAELDLNDFNVLVDRKSEGERILLLQKKERIPIPAPETVEVVKIPKDDDFQWIETLKNTLSSETIKSVILVAEKDKHNGLLGLTNCLRKEPGGEKVRCVFTFDDDAPAFDLKYSLYEEQLKKGLAINVLKEGEWGTYRHVALPKNEKIKAEHIYINTEVRGDLTSLTAYEGPLNINKCENEIDIYYSSLNFRDVMLATGKLAIDAACKGRINQELPIGFEFSGRVAKTGKRVLGMGTNGALASKIDTKNVLMWDVPDDWTLEQAATVAVVYGTVYSAFIVNGRIKKGESILIHSGTGGIGLAALNVALSFGCNIFTTVGTPEKREFLRKHYPQIPESHIGNSRDLSFEDLIIHETNGRGVDVILNSLAEEKLLASVRCLAPGGRFLEIGKFDLANDNPLGMELFSNNRSFHGIHLDAIFDCCDEKRDELLHLLGSGLDKNSVVPLVTTVFDYTECEQAVRYMTSGKHIGKVLLKMRDEEPSKICISPPKLFDAVPRFSCIYQKSYIILGGLGGFGLELADWLVMRGARNLVLTSRTGVKTGYQSLRIRLWKNYGAKVVISTEDITTENGVTRLLQKANELGPVDAIFNLAVVLRDAIFENQTAEFFTTSFGPKAVATKLLDKISRELCPTLNYFVIFSSVSCGRGNAGQTNYGMANSVMERICEARVEEGYPALAIEWGAIGEVGLVAEMQEDHQEMVIGGTLQQSISSCLKCLDVFLKQNHPIVASMVVAEKKSGGSGSGNIVDCVLNILGIADFKTVSLHSSLADLGMDSMMAVEIKQTLEREFDVYLTAQDIRGLTFAKLAELAAKTDKESDGEKGPAAHEKFDFEKESYLGILLRFISDEETAMKNSVPLPHTEISNPTFEKIKSIYGSLPPIFFIPGIEGVGSEMSNLAIKLHSPVISLQFPYNDSANCDIKIMSSKLLETMKTHLVPNGPFIIVGHSAGTLAGLEMMIELENQGHKGKMILLDGAPVLLKKIIKDTFKVGFEDDHLFDAQLISFMFDAFVPGMFAQLIEEIIKIPTFTEKMAFARDAVPDTKNQNMKHQQILTIDVKHRLKSIAKYEVSPIKNPVFEIVLIRPNSQIYTSSHNLPEDYDLAKVYQRKVEVHYVDGNHLTMLDSQQLADMINKYYLEEIESVFSKQGLENIFKPKDEEKIR